MLACPYCKTEVPTGERFCPACLLGLRVEGDALAPVFPTITPGRTLYEADFRTSPPPRYPSRAHAMSPRMRFDPHEGGLLFTLLEPRTPTFPNPDVELRDACVRARFTVLDPGARIGVVARRSALAEGRVGYALDVTPDRNEAWLKRVFEANAHADSTTVAIRKGHAGIPAPGPTTDVELRLLGPTIQIVVDGALVATHHDPHYGVGAFGFRVGRETEASDVPVRVVCHGFDVREVIR